MKTINLKIKGMVCSGCENRVQKALKNINGVLEVIANHENGEVIITTNKDVKESELSATLENLGYVVIKEN